MLFRSQEAGHNVKLYQKPKHEWAARTGRGIVERVPDWQKWMQWANIIVPTSNAKHLDRLEDFRKYGYPIFGPSKASANLEINRQAGMEFLK